MKTSHKSLKNLYTDDHISFVYNSKILTTPQVSVSGCMAQPTGTYLYTEKQQRDNKE